MKKSLLAMTALAAMLFAGCTSSDELTTLESIKKADNVATPVSFGTYMGRTGTRAGLVGIMNDTQLKLSDANGGGFGLFAYYTDNSTYTSSKPNFMWNQGVFYNSSATSSATKWEYTPVKYWPNETSTTNNEGQNSKSAGVDRLTFFAYAPYVTQSEITADPSKGITSITSNATTGDPKIGYTVAVDQDDAVDLLWGVIPSDVPTWANVTGTAMTNTTDPAFTVGLPYRNLLKPEKDQVVKFLFRHALAKISVGVQVVNDQVDPTSSSFDNTNTKVFVKSITITSKTTDGFGTSGILNLNNTAVNTPLWESVNNTTATALAADESGEIASALFWDSPADATARNTQFAKTGVTQALLNIASGAAPQATDKGWMVVPTGSKNDFTVNIDYFVMTQDSNLETGYSIVENNITKDVSVASTGFAGGYNYQIILLLGLTSVKVDASVQDWDNGTPVEVDLPMNVE